MKPTTYGSVCSGIEAASVAWQPLGWRPLWLSEIEPGPCAILAHRFPDTPNLGDMLLIRHDIDMGSVEPPDVLVGGTPCQSFSVAGMREGLADERGQLTVEFVKLADAIDEARVAAGQDECITVWENVPGVLSSKDNAFGCFLGALAGEDCELKPAGPKWSNAGCVFGPKRAIAWRLLDAQYFGVAQRRRRLFVVASARDGFDPAAILFEFDGLRRDTPPSREAGQSTAHDVAPSLVASGRGVERCGDTRGQDPVVAMPILEPGARTGKSTTDVRAGIGIGSDGDPMFTLQASKQQGVAHSVSLRGREGGATAELGGEVAGALRASTGGGDKPHMLYSEKKWPADIASTLDTTMQKYMGYDNQHVNAGCPWFVPHLTPTWVKCECCDDYWCNKHDTHVSCCDCPPLEEWQFDPYGLEVQGPAVHVVHGTQDPDLSDNRAHTLGRDSGQENAVFAFAENSRAELRLEGGDGSRTGALSTGGGKPGQGVPCAQVHMAVRRLTPVECERLQGFPDNWTSVPSGKKRSVKPDMLAYLQAHHPDLDEAEIKTLVADGTRYKAIGNSMAVPVMHWIGRRIDQWVRQNGGDK